MEEAQIEAAKHAEIEKRKLEEQHRLQMEAMAKQQAHEKEIHVIQSQKRKGLHPGAMAGIGVTLLAALFAVIFFVSIKPANDAKDAVKKAQTFAASDEPSQWDEADRQLAIARDKDPTNKDIAPISDKVKSKRDKLASTVAAAKKAQEDELKATKEKLAKLTQDLDDAQNELKNATSDEAKKAAAKKVADAQAALKGSPAAAAPKAKVCPPGVPLCN